MCPPMGKDMTMIWTLPKIKEGNRKLNWTGNSVLNNHVIYFKFFRIRQLGEKQKIKEKSREREKPNVELESKKETKSKIPENIRKRGESERVPPSQVNSDLNLELYE